MNYPTPTICKYHKCRWNYLPPPENSQECIACDGLRDPKWKPKGRKKRP
ncbi:hypothetical protein ES703_104773 [subsurface metagenome]